MPRVAKNILQESPLKPVWTTSDGDTVQLFHGDVLTVLRRMPPKSVQCVVTSPPYWGLRSYDTGKDKEHELGSEAIHDCHQLKDVGGGLFRRSNCAERDWTKGCHVCRIVLVFREVRRVLRNDGTLWLNYGDSYDYGGNLMGVPWRVALACQADGWILRQDIIWHKPSPMPESVKNRCTKAHEYVFLFAKQAGYFYDAEAIKEKSLHGGKADRYRNGSGYVDQDSIAANQGHSGDVGDKGTIPERSNKRSVWTVSSQGYEGSHFATFPTKLIELMIKAGTSQHGCCTDCQAPWVRVTEEKQLLRDRPNDYVKRTGEEGTGNSCSNSVAGVEVKTVGWRPSCECRGKLVKRKVVVKGTAISNEGGGLPGGWAAYEGSHVTTKTASLDGGKGKEVREAYLAGQREKVRTDTVIEYVSDLALEDHPIIPCTVLDVFIGSGTSCCVSLALGRRSIGIDLSLTYLLQNAVPRIEGELLSRPSMARLVLKEFEIVKFGEG